MWDKLAEVEQRYLDLEHELAQPELSADPARMAKLSRDFSELEDVVKPYREALKVKQHLEQSKLDLRTETDEELREMLKQDIDELTPRLEAMELELRSLVAPKDPMDRKNCIVEIRAGAGGDEAALFASELLTMYTAFAGPPALGDVDHRPAGDRAQGHQGSGAGSPRTRSLTAGCALKAACTACSACRSRRAAGRIHTSTATVAVLAEVDDVEVDVKESDLRIDVYRSSGAGGQHVNKTSSAIRITHIPTGIVVTCQDERSQLQNKDKAMRVLKSKLYLAEQEKQAEQQTELRRSQVGTGDRAEKIRTYNFPDSRITDHRIGVKVHNIEDFLAGGLHDMLQALRTHDEGERLSRL